MRMRLRPARSWPMQASNPDRAAGHATIAISLPFHLPASLQTERTSCPATSDRLFERLAANRLRPTQVATGLVVPLTGLLSLLDLVVVAEVEPLQTSARITHLEIGRVAIVSRCDVVGDVAELSAVGSVEGTAQFGLPLERCLRHQRDYSKQMFGCRRRKAQPIFCRRRHQLTGHHQQRSECLLRSSPARCIFWTRAAATMETCSAAP